MPLRFAARQLWGRPFHMCTGWSHWYSRHNAAKASRFLSEVAVQAFGSLFAFCNPVSETNLLHENLDLRQVTVYDQQRREERLSVSIPVEITGIDRAGHLFTELTLVEDVTEIGCRFDIRTQLQCGDVIAVKPLGLCEKSLMHEKSHLFEVVWAAHHRAVSTIGARKLEGEKLVKVKFSPPNYSPGRPAK